MISGVSDICGTSYSAEKGHAKVSKMENEKGPQKNTMITNQKEIMFDETDMLDVQDPHHNGLLITLYIANHFVRRLLVDGGSSVNIILVDALKIMSILESEIVTRSSVLIDFSGETKHTISKIKLPIYIEGVDFVQCFCVIDKLSSYNVILGRPWIHEMKADPSTYHQCVKMSTHRGQ
ncbi:uncharacterized protein LOC111907173 [Lactuca sativa]|uniref:uncharacterized protein LOC111907173 n=1 Tax=Lactuca sativa TaxID=4236 RepID=UPI000CD91253|nr:uncharacterized protein LOC111907173 [Lactuca sativa]